MCILCYVRTFELFRQLYEIQGIPVVGFILFVMFNLLKTKRRLLY